MGSREAMDVVVVVYQDPQQPETFHPLRVAEDVPLSYYSYSCSCCCCCCDGLLTNIPSCHPSCDYCCVCCCCLAATAAAYAAAATEAEATLA